MGAWALLILGLLIGARGLAYSEHGIGIAIVMVVGFFLLTRLVAAFWMNYLIKNTITGENILFPCGESLQKCGCPKGTGNNILKGEYIAIASFLLLCIGASFIYLYGSSGQSQEKQPEDPFAELATQEESQQFVHNSHSEDDLDDLLSVFDSKPDQDNEKVAEGYRKAASEGIAEAQFNLGMMYFNGTGVNKDYKTAEFWWQKAADQGYSAAQYNIGNLYYGSGIYPQNNDEALKWYSRAANQGYAPAQFNLAIMYVNGHGVFQNDVAAANWCQKAAMQGLANAQLMLGAMYKKGQGVSRDYMAAFNWVEKAALQGFPAAQACLGDFYQEGIGVNRDRSKAAFWYGKAADQGLEIARESLNRLNSPYNTEFTDALEGFAGPGGISESDKKLMGNALYNLNNIGK